MILDNLDESTRYETLHGRFSAAFAFLRQPDLDTLSIGRHEIDGEHLVATTFRGPGRPREAAPLEAHNRYIDVQYVIAGNESMGWKPRADCVAPTTDFDRNKDIQFFGDEPESWFHLRAGQFVIFYPNDAHAPLVSTAEIHKVVVKIAR